MPTIQCFTTNVSLHPGPAFLTRNNRSFTMFSFPRRSTKYGLLSHRFSLYPSSIGLFPQNHRTLLLHRMSERYILSATGTDAAVGDQDSSVAVESSSQGVPSNSAETTEGSAPNSDASPAQTKATRTKPARRSDMPPVKNEDLVPGATFTGKVKSIQPFGAFVDIGAFTDGLVHISRLSNDFVKDVGSFVSVGQEVKVKLVEVNTETQRIALSMRDIDDGQKQQPKDALASEDKAPTGRRNTTKTRKRTDGVKKSTKFVVGQELQGTVKNMNKSGAFISLLDGEEGFLPTSEEDDQGFGDFVGSSSLEIGQAVTVSVLRIGRGQVTLTMKKEEDDERMDSSIPDKVLSIGTNPFVLAFRKNKNIASFLEEREKMLNKVEKSEIPVVPMLNEETDKLTDGVSSSVTDTYEGDISNKEFDVRASSDNTQGDIVDMDICSSSYETTLEEADSITSTLSPEIDLSTTNPENEEVLPTDETESSKRTNKPVHIDNEIFPSESLIDGDTGGRLAENNISKNTEDEGMTNTVLGMTNTAEFNIPSAPLDHENVGAATEADSSDSSNGLVSSSLGSSTEEPAKSEVSLASPEIERAEPPPVKEDSKSNSIGESGIMSSGHGSNEVAVSPTLVKQLREETGAGMMDCKRALAATGGDIVKAQEFLRKKGLASAEKKASRATAEGRIGAYIHDSRIGVLVEVNCETDFVSRGDIFKELVDDLAMQVAACPQVEYLTTEDVSLELVNKEREIEIQKEDLLSKPEQIRLKIVEGRIRKRLEELALLEQPYIKNDNVLVKDWVKQTIATIGENIKVKRFVRFNLGEGLEKKSQNFAAEVAAQTAAKPITPENKEQPATEEAKEVIEKPKASVSPALVKQLREETGAGMMDCKKALAETGGDLEKAQEYLRKKGLSSAEKKSSRLAAEGRIGSYIHDSRIGVLIEVNCETDFVGRSEQFKELVDDLAMQVVACPQVQFVSLENIAESIVNKEKEIEMQKEDLLSKPENIREKIVEGRISKRLGELALLEQPFIKDDSVLVKDLVKQKVAALGENIKIRRFVRFTLGEKVENETSKSE